MSQCVDAADRRRTPNARDVTIAETNRIASRMISSARTRACAASRARPLQFRRTATEIVFRVAIF